jgi:hypothetical protein
VKGFGYTSQVVTIDSNFASIDAALIRLHPNYGSMQWQANVTQQMHDYHASDSREIWRDSCFH